MLTVLWTTVPHASGTYIAWNKKVSSTTNTRVHHKAGKTNHIDRTKIKPYGPSFKHDRDIQRYLKIYGKDMMIWRCKRAIQPYWTGKPIPLVELYCEAIGSMKSIEWSRNFQKIDLSENRYGQSIVPHFSRGRYYSRWIDFKLKIYNATKSDSGMYSFKVTSPRGTTRQQYIYVDISEKKRGKRKGRKNRKRQRGQRISNDVHG